MSKGFDNLSHFQTRQMLEFFMFEMPNDQRQRLAATLPKAYNAWCGDKIVQVVSVDNPEKVW